MGNGNPIVYRYLMAYRYYIDQEMNCAFVQHIDVYNYADGINVLDEVINDSAFNNGMNILRDASTTSLPVDMLQKSFLPVGRGWAKDFDSQLEKCKIAWILSSAQDFAAVHRIVVSARLSSSVERKPFRDIFKAREWLGIPASYKINHL